MMLPVAAALPLTAFSVVEPLVPTLPAPYPASTRTVFFMGSLLGVPIVSFVAIAGWMLVQRRWRRLALLAALTLCSIIGDRDGLAMDRRPVDAGDRALRLVGLVPHAYRRCIRNRRDAFTGLGHPGKGAHSILLEKSPSTCLTATRRRNSSSLPARADRPRRAQLTVAGLAVAATVVLMLGTLAAWRYYSEWRLGHVVLTTDGPALLGQILAEATDTPIGEPFSIGPKSPLALPAGDYRLRSAGSRTDGPNLPRGF